MCLCALLFVFLLCVHLQSHGPALNVWRHPFPASLSAKSEQPEILRHAAAKEREVYSQTSLLCYGCKMEAEKENKEM